MKQAHNFARAELVPFTPTGFHLQESPLKKILIYLILIVFAGSSPAQELLIVHTNDLHGHITEEKEYAGAARIAAFVRELRANHPLVLFVDAGDAISGTPVSDLFEGEPIFDVMNAMGYDAGLLGNHEFEYGADKITRFREIAKFPLLGATAFDSQDRVLSDSPFIIIERGTLKIGIIGILTDTTITPHGNKNLTFKSPAEVLKQLIPAIRPKVDFLMVLSHTGFTEDIALAKQFQEIDLFVGGHSHTFNKHPVNTGRNRVVQADKHGRHLGLVKINIDPKLGPMEFTGYLLAADELPQPDANVLSLVETYESQVGAWYRLKKKITHAVIHYLNY